MPEDIHAGRGETSSMLNIRPDLVKEEFQNIDSPGFVGQEFNDYVGLDKTTKTGAWGIPSEGSAEQGKERRAASIQRQADYVRWVLKKIEELRNAPSIVDEKES